MVGQERLRMWMTLMGVEINGRSAIFCKHVQVSLTQLVARMVNGRFRFPTYKTVR